MSIFATFVLLSQNERFPYFMSLNSPTIICNFPVLACAVIIGVGITFGITNNCQMFDSFQLFPHLIVSQKVQKETLCFRGYQ